MSPAIATDLQRPHADRVVGLDVSMTCTGIVGITSGPGRPPAIDSATVTSKGRRGDTLTARRTRIGDIVDGVLDHAGAPALAVIENPTTGVKGASPIDRHGLWWGIVAALVDADIPVAVVVASSLKLAIAGKGNADKAAVAIAVERLWPGMDVSSSDVSDAAGLAHLGAVHLGWDVPTLERHRTVKATWPELGETPGARIRVEVPA